MNDRSQQQPVVPRRGPRLDRRRLVRSLAGGVILVANACSHGSAQVQTDNGPTPVPTAPISNLIPARPTPTSTSTPASPQATPNTSATATASPEPQILYRGGFTADPVSHDFNANLYCGGDPSLWSGLLTLNTDLTPMGDWANAWEANVDSSQWTFHIRPNNEGWSNGKSVTAKDFVWSWRRLLDPATKAPQAWLFFDIVNALAIHSGQAKPDSLGVHALDNWTLRVELVGPRVYFPAIVATVGTVPAYQPAVEAFGDKWTEAAHCVSNGPFKLDIWQHGDHWTTLPNANHWNALHVRLETTVVPIVGPEKHQQPFFNDEVDFMPVAEEDVANVRSISDIGGEMVSSMDPAVWFLMVAPSVPPFDDLRVRQAVAHSIDRDRLEQLSQGRAAAASSLIPTTFPIRGEDDTVTAIQQFDVDQALKLLADTPHANGSNWPPITLFISESAEVPQLLANDCAQQLLENLGMKVEVRTVSAQDFETSLANRTGALFWKRWDFTYADPNNGYSDAFSPIGSDTYQLPNVPSGFGDLVGRAKAEPNEKARALIYRDCEKTLQTEVSYIPIAYPITFYLIRPWVAGFPLVGDSSVLQPGTLFTRLTSLVSIKNRSSG